MPARDLKLQEALFEYSQDNRVLLLAHSDEPLPAEGLPARLHPIALILLQDNIRKEMCIRDCSCSFFITKGRNSSSAISLGRPHW